MEKIITYDEENDILAIHKGFNKDEKFDGCIDVGDIILDLSTKGNIRGIEFLNATEILADYKITKEALSNLKKADFLAKGTKHGITIRIKFLINKKEIPALISMPIQN
ncbi:DUF2283 domain-containing protein [archaeon]|nr:DUF2283 domain-containing protein [archaeon]